MTSEPLVVTAHPARRWYDSSAGARAAAAVLGVVQDAATAISEADVARADAVLSAWEERVDVAQISAQALFSIRSAFADARWAVGRGRFDDARAYVQAVATMCSTVR